MMYPKPARIRSKALTESAMGQECTLRITARCDPATVVFCHVRGVGDGIGTKPPDFWGYYGCATCHAAEESKSVPAHYVLDAIRETQERMAIAGLLQVKGWKP